MAYVSLYRKYRPQTFDDVVGQEHVTSTLRNAVSAGRVGSGYLFTGTRGTAKTTCARILAKALNCVGPDGSLTSAQPEPCGVCPPCRSIATSSFVDVLEMDAASHGKVDDVRDLVASIKFPPMEGRFKVYIIDEAHQLSRDAMDAFLKTLEEPPDRVVFVLATTELDKLPITIASRCQVFEFKRGSVAAISGRLNFVLAAEAVSADPAAVTLIARAADGSYRDSLSLLEQVLAYKPNDITPFDVSRVLGTVDDDQLSDVVARIAAHDAAGAFAAADAITSAGKDVRQFIRTLSARLRDILFVTVGAHAGEAEIASAARDQVGLLTSGALLHALEILSETERDMRWSNQHRLVLEITLLRLCALGDGAVNLTASVTGTAVRPTERAQPRESVQSSEPQVVVTPIATAPTALAPHTPGARRGFPVPGEKRPSPPPTPAAVADAQTPPTVPREEIVAVVAAARVGPAIGLERETSDFDAPDLDDEAGPDNDGEYESDTMDVADLEIDEMPLVAVTTARDHDDLLMVQQVPTAPSPFAAMAAPASADTPASLVKLQRSWQEVINRMGSKSPAGVPVVRDATPIALEGSTIILRFKSEACFDRLDKNERGRSVLEEIINRTLGVEPNTYRVRCVWNDRHAMENAPAVLRQSAAPTQLRKGEEAPHEEPDALLETVIAVFGGQVIDQ